MVSIVSNFFNHMYFSTYQRVHGFDTTHQNVMDKSVQPDIKE